MARDYGRKIGVTGDFYIEPKQKEPMKHQYDFDTATAIGFLRKYRLELLLRDETVNRISAALSASNSLQCSLVQAQ